MAHDLQQKYCEDHRMKRFGPEEYQLLMVDPRCLPEPFASGDLRVIFEPTIKMFYLRPVLFGISDEQAVIHSHFAAEQEGVIVFDSDNRLYLSAIALHDVLQSDMLERLLGIVKGAAQVLMDSGNLKLGD